jgi:RNA polymerase sigma factor for flagellar operon FliA
MDAQATHEQVEARVRELTPAVKRIAHNMRASLPASVELDDLIQTGMLGLLDAAKRYDSGEGAQFESYAVHRIRGAMIDGLRASDWIPRNVRRRMRDVEAMISRLEQQTGRAPTEAEIANALDISLRDYQQLLYEARGYQILSYEDFSANQEEFLERYIADEKADPLQLLESRCLREVLIKAIDHLPEREKTVVALLYQEELRQRDIAAVLGVTESRVCQLLAQAVARLRVVVRASLGA